MMNNQNNKWLFLLMALFLFSNNVRAQQATSSIVYSGTKGLYIVTLPQELLAINRGNIGNIRIKNSDGVAAPFVKLGQLPLSNDTSFVPIPNIVSESRDSVSTYIIPLSTGATRQKIQLQIANTTVNKTYTIEGSNDKKEWFTITGNAVLQNILSEKNSTVFKTISFPVSSYSFLRFSFDDRSSAPLKIVKWGDVQYSKAESNNVLVPVSNFDYQLQQQIAEKRTTIVIHKHHLLPINQATFYISEPQFYKRRAQLYTEEKQKIKSKDVVQKNVVQYFELSNSHANSVSLAGLSDSIFYLTIENEDNPALKVDSIGLWSPVVQLIVQLEDKQTYTLTIDTTLSMPQYDLSTDEIVANKEQLSAAEIQNIVVANNTVAASKASASNQWVLWLCIGVGVLVMFYFGYRLLADMKSKSA